MISADEHTYHGSVVKLMDALKQAGIAKFAINVDSK
jgi:biopolymer transport protein ExbD